MKPRHAKDVHNNRTDNPALFKSKLEASSFTDVSVQQQLQSITTLSQHQRIQVSHQKARIYLCMSACINVLQVQTHVALGYSPLYTLSVMVRTAIRTMLSGWLKNLMASVYRAKSLVCCVWETDRGRRWAKCGRVPPHSGQYCSQRKRGTTKASGQILSIVTSQNCIKVVPTSVSNYK